MMVRIRISGCDDETTFQIDVNTDERIFLERLAKLSEENSDYGCQPELIVSEVIE